MRKLFKVGVIVGSLAFGGYIYAQSDAGAEDTTPTATPTAEPQQPHEELTPQQMIEKADELIKKMRDGLKEVIKIQRVARKQQDVIKLNCVNDKLLQVKQLLNISEGASTDMQEAIAQNDETERYHQFGKIEIGNEQVNGLVEEAKNCIGEELIYIGPLQIDVDAPEVEDPDQDPFPDDIDIDPPAYASPFA